MGSKLDKFLDKLLVVLTCTALFLGVQSQILGPILGGSIGFNIVQIYATNSTTNHGTDTCAGFFNTTTTSCTFTPNSNQGIGNFAVIGFNAQAVGISAGQTLSSVSDSSGSTWTHLASCAEFFSGNAKVSDCWITSNTVGSGSPPLITIHIATPVSGGERIMAFYVEAQDLAGAGLATVDGTAQQLNLTTSCGASGSACVGIPGSSFAFGGPSEFCVEWIVNGPTEASVTAPWSTNYANNGDHSAVAAAVNLTSSFAAPQFTAASSSAAIVDGVCVK